MIATVETLNVVVLVAVALVWILFFCTIKTR